ncbi:Wadjet anti-phage system protein JetD domain-containing protein [Amycolatopsis benzoatilytica]|uniref:Wadjet anti-phage system protein JetD domain-containing protein n=1 Tax=Amycolatopsis benzoatilytica TaxID=346045 RepID=UPI00035DE020|nr:Wadjet anti-phage system protein JetD domain-containing protein [Amycolatopsis benzoatilytica]
MSALVNPEDAVAVALRKVERKWAEAVCAELGIGDQVTFTVPLRPGVSTGKAVEQLGHAAWHQWHMQWRTFSNQLPDGVELIRKAVTVQRVAGDFPATLVADLDGVVSLAARMPAGTEPPIVDVDRARALASALRAASAILTPGTLRAVYRLRTADVDVLLSAVTWLHQHPDASAWTLRQLPVPGMHTKWLDTHGVLLREVAGRDVRDEVRPRLTVAHLTYVDPDHAALGRRRHDAWTTGDVHDIAYQPRLVLVVENRDSRLWFPPMRDTIVVEGGGKAASALLANVPWIRAADHVVYWGDIDADGYAILDQFRATLAAPAPDGAPARPVSSILMDATDLHHYAQHGVNHDKAGRPIKPSPEILPHLTEAENTAYNTVATAGPTPFRRIEQEAIPLTHAATRLLQILEASAGR